MRIDDLDTSRSLHLFGRKVETLRRLRQAGFPVPPGICLPVNALEKVPGSRSKRSPGQRLPASVMAEIWAAVQQSCGGSGENHLYAVRSSAAGEDGGDASFAGVYKTVLGAQGIDGLERAIRDVWQSFFTPTPVTYAESMPQPQTKQRHPSQHHAILIQPLLDAVCAGVCFTIDPVSARADLLVINAGWGLGSGVVDGSMPTDIARVQRIDLRVVDYDVADKPYAIRPNPSGGVAREPVDPVRQTSACLPDDWLRQVAMFGLAVEQALGEPQDIEWAITGGQIWILQSRPISKLPEQMKRAVYFPIEWESDEERKRTWWLEEHHAPREGALLLPVELEFTRQTTQRGGQMAVVYAGGNQTRWRRFEHGRVYIARAESPLLPGDQRIRSAAFYELHERMHAQGLTLWDFWGPEIVRATERLAAFDGQKASGSELAEHLENAMAASARHWMVHTFIPRGRRFEKLLDAYTKLTGKPRHEVENDISYLVTGAETMQTRLVTALYDLAHELNSQSSARKMLEDHLPSSNFQIKSFLDAVNPTFREQFNSLIANYGGRICYRHVDGYPTELPFPWREAPVYVLELLANYLPDPSNPIEQSPRENRIKALSDQQAFVEAACSGSSDQESIQNFMRLLEFARRNATFTDEHNHYIDQVAIGEYCQALLYAGRWLAIQGHIDQPYEIYFLHLNEIHLALLGQAHPNLQSIAAARMADFERWQAIIPPAVLGLHDPALPEWLPQPGIGNRNEDHSPDIVGLSGQPASPGKRSGRARILNQSAGLPDIQPGDVLVTTEASFLWSPVIPILAGLVTEWGSPGSHAAITAREFGVPAVSGIGSGILNIKEGMWLTVDGSRGTVLW